MNAKRIMLSGLMLLGLTAASAQESTKTEYVFNPHWYIQAQGGAQYTLGEADFSDLLSPNVQLGVGYQFKHWLGARLSVNAWQSKGGYELHYWNLQNQRINLDADWKYKYVSPMVDATFNVSNLLFGFNPKRVFNFSVFAGVGANIAWDNDEAGEAKKCAWDVLQANGVTVPADRKQNMDYYWEGTKTRLTGRVGVQGDFRISDRVSLGLEVNANTLSDRYNSKRAGNSDWYFNCLAGVKINLGKSYTTREIKPEPAKVIERVVERIVEKPVPTPAPVALPKTDAVKKVASIERNVFFTIGVTNISAAEQKKVAEVADFLKENPDAKVQISGYADMGTGNNAINDKLAAARATTVKNMLVKKYGIAASRISTESFGSRVQPFSENDKNRVAICVAK